MPGTASLTLAMGINVDDGPKKPSSGLSPPMFTLPPTDMCTLLIVAAELDAHGSDSSVQGAGVGTDAIAGAGGAGVAGAGSISGSGPNSGIVVMPSTTLVSALLSQGAISTQASAQGIM